LRYFFLIFILFLSELNASPLITVESDKTKLTDFSLEYFIDQTTELSLEEVRRQQFIKDKSSLSLGIFQEVAWLRFRLHNSTLKHQEIYLHNENGYLANELEFYALQDSKIVNSLQIKLRDKEQTEKYMFGTDSIFIISLDSNETQEIYIKSTMVVMQYPHFTLYDGINSKRQVSKNNSLLFLIVGMLISLGLYHFILYFSTRFKAYLYYSLYMFSALVWESILSGFLANNFGIYFNNTSEKLLLSVTLIPLFLVLFSKSIFDTKLKYQKENRYLNPVIVLSILMFFLGFYDLPLTLVFMSSIYIYMFGVLFFTTYSIMKKGNPFAFIFLIANTLFSLLMIVTNLYYLGIINYSSFAFNSASIGVVTEAILLSLLLSYRFKILQKKELENSKKLIRQKSKIQEELEKSRKKDKILFQQQKLVSMGEMIENIAHQWRQPLSQINSSVLVIDNYLDTKGANYEEIESKLLEIEELTLYMSKTIDSFKNFFDPHKVQTIFSIEKVIKASLLILQNSVQINSIDISCNIDKGSNYFGLEDELQQVLIIILNNAKDALIENQTPNAKISINTILKENSYLISITDNAGGVDKSIIDNIFEPYFTTKHKAQGTGLGLYISKLIIQENMNGSLNVKNSSSGAVFEIELPNRDSCSI